MGFIALFVALVAYWLAAEQLAPGGQYTIPWAALAVFSVIGADAGVVVALLRRSAT